MVRIAFIKRIGDGHGPCMSCHWRDTTPAQLLEMFLGDTAHWQMTSRLQADWYVLPQKVGAIQQLSRGVRHRLKEMVQGRGGGVSGRPVLPFGLYDIVVDIEPSIEIEYSDSAIVACFAGACCTELDSRSFRMAMKRYDLLLNPTLNSEWAVHRLPQAISFPYLCDPRTARNVFSTNGKEAVLFVDWRTMSCLATQINGFDSLILETAAKRLESVLGVGIRFVKRSKEGHLPNNPTRYFSELARCAYYASFQMSDTGQEVPEAASLGCICFGVKRSPYHRLLCHPACLCADMAEFPEKLRIVVRSTSLQRNIIEWQDKMLDIHFGKRPIQLLERALELKERAKKRQSMGESVQPAD